MPKLKIINIHMVDSKNENFYLLRDRLNAENVLLYQQSEEKRIEIAARQAGEELLIGQHIVSNMLLINSAQSKVI